VRSRSEIRGLFGIGVIPSLPASEALRERRTGEARVRPGGSGARAPPVGSGARGHRFPTLSSAAFFGRAPCGRPDVGARVLRCPFPDPPSPTLRPRPTLRSRATWSRIQHLCPGGCCPADLLPGGHRVRSVPSLDGAEGVTPAHIGGGSSEHPGVVGRRLGVWFSLPSRAARAGRRLASGGGPFGGARFGGGLPRVARAFTGERGSRPVRRRGPGTRGDGLRGG
jgi:hypothetical protein